MIKEPLVVGLAIFRALRLNLSSIFQKSKSENWYGGKKDYDNDAGMY
jgi:hypothetical protein